MFELLATVPVHVGSDAKSISVYCGDLTSVPDEHSLDLLVISAFPDNYSPTSTSLIGALAAGGLSVDELAKNKLHDLREICNFWLSDRLRPSSGISNVTQIACFETMRQGHPAELVGNLFRGLFPFLSLESNAVVGMPLLAAGNQGSQPSVMFDAILDAAYHWMSIGLGIAELKIVILDSQLAQEMSKRLCAFSSETAKAVRTDRPKFDVFLSFSSADQHAADLTIQALLSRDDVKEIFDYRLEIDRGVAWQAEIDRAICSSNAIVAITSPAYFASPECQEELAQARLRHKREGGSRLFPIHWRSTEKEMDLWLQVINTSDCREQDKQKLKEEIQRLRFRSM